jgi:hypothetical protein
VIDILTMQKTGLNFIIISFFFNFFVFCFCFYFLKSLVIGQMHLENMQVPFSTAGNCSFHLNSQTKVDAQCSDHSSKKWYG